MSPWMCSGPKRPATLPAPPPLKNDFVPPSSGTVTAAPVYPSIRAANGARPGPAARPSEVASTPVRTTTHAIEARCMPVPPAGIVDAPGAAVNAGGASAKRRSHQLEGRDLTRAVEAQRRAADAESTVHVHHGVAGAEEAAGVARRDAREVQVEARRRERELAAVGVAGDHQREAEARRLAEELRAVDEEQRRPVFGAGGREALERRELDAARRPVVARVLDAGEVERLGQREAHDLVAQEAQVRSVAGEAASDGP